MNTVRALVVLAFAALLGACSMNVQESHFLHPGPAQVAAPESFARIAASPFVRVRISESLRDVSNVHVVERYRGPLLLMTGSRDKVTPPVFARRLYERSGTPVELKRVSIVEGRDHGDVLASEQAIADYRAFLGLVAAAPPPAR